MDKSGVICDSDKSFMLVKNSVCALSADTCTEPVISTSSYTTADAVISSETVFIVELSLACGNGAQVKKIKKEKKSILYELKPDLQTTCTRYLFPAGWQG